MERIVVFGSAENYSRFSLEAYDQAYQVLRPGSGPRGKAMLEVGAP
jgi:hypothetical protein